MTMPSRPRQTGVTTNSIRAGYIGAALLRQRVLSAPVEDPTKSPVEDPTKVQPFPARVQERAEDIAVRLQFLLARQSRGETQWGSRMLVDAIADCQAELSQAEEHEGRNEPHQR